jgi:putative selenate reductase
MSVGYNLEGITSPRMTEFMDKPWWTHPAAAREIKDTLRRDFPQFADIDIPTRMTTSVTLSTMHGCPPDEIERIAKYMLEERKLHTIVKLNPTLLGKEQVLDILHRTPRLHRDPHPGLSVRARPQVPEGAGTDPRSSRGGGARARVRRQAEQHAGDANHRQVDAGRRDVHVGPRALPVTMNLFNKLAHEFDGDLRVSYSAGADALNTRHDPRAAPLPVTSCSDLLKPGGYARFGQYLENLEAAMEAAGAASLAEFSRNKLANLEEAAAEALTDHRYKKEAFPYGLPKVKDDLGVLRLRAGALHRALRGVPGRAGVRVGHQPGQLRPSP